jgi:hypothetical protein
MNAYVSVYPLLQTRRRRAFFWSETTQQVRRSEALTELARGLLALGALAAWVALVLVVAA